MRTCQRCGRTLEFSEFNWTSRAKGWLQSYCKACSRAYVRDHYERNVAYYIAKAHARNLVYREDIRARLLAFFLAHPCVDCGEQDAIVLQFDHEDPSRKSATVADLFKRGFSWRTIEKEIAKCQIRCAMITCGARRGSSAGQNCHNRLRNRMVSAAGVAQLAERLLPKQKVSGSSPLTRSVRLLPSRPAARVVRGVAGSCPVSRSAS